MGTLAPNSIAAEAHDRNHQDQVVDGNHAKVVGDHDADDDKLDAGAKFVLKSKGSWVHCGYHLTTSIVAPPLLSLPYAFTFLGWTGGIVCLVIGALVTFYSYNLISLVLEHYAQLGHRHLRFRDMARDILGPKWGRYFVGPIQFLVCYGAVVACTLLGGQCMKAVYMLTNPNGSMKLYEFVIIFGCFMLILAQIPSFHSLRHINLVSMILCLAYSVCATAACIHIGSSSKGPAKDYSLKGNSQNQIFGIFNANAIIATTYGNGIIPEIQATIAPPVKGKMFKGLCVCYTIVTMTFFSVAISGYWAFGNQSEGLILSNFLSDGNPLVPKWFIFMTNIFTILQLSAVGVVYLQPTNEVLERAFADPTSKEFSARNVIPRMISRSLSVITATTIAAMLPFFGDINAVIGAFGFMPLDFILPVVFFNLTFKPSKRSFIFWLNTTIAVVFSIMGVLAAIAAVRQISLDANSYKLFANV
ncbi:PREDICTED: GABA transporter 1 [Fragaria vesca subsp. vesca]|uniref:GABA transporter 1 n=1 Tax=Fragaria vesca subsp. vesca TaxID=101020 RepID=UPI0002C35E55|nr:PREDICTED: GABA transporter 1 [Fragaria vesca subsp. vesca]